MNFFTFFAVKLKYTKIYSNGYNIGIFETNCIISGIIWGNGVIELIGMGMGGRNGRWAQLQIVLRKESIDSNY